MSDGPHKTLPLRKHWKDVAERAAKAAFSPVEICEALPVALKRDFFADAPIDLVRDILSGGDQPSLFSDRIEELELARQVSPSAVGSIFINCAIEAVQSGHWGEAALQSAVANALDEHTRGTFRSMEEHYQRVESDRSAQYLRGRLETARRQSDFNSLANEIVGSTNRSVRAVQLPKRTGIDEGPSL